MDKLSFLNQNKLMNLATISDGNGPCVVPVAFMYNDGRFYFSSGEKTNKIRSIRNDNRVGFSIENTTRQMAVVGRGTANVLPADRSHDETLNKLVMHLLGGLDHPYAKIMMAPGRVIVEITPGKLRGWDLPPT